MNCGLLTNDLVSIDLHNSVHVKATACQPDAAHREHYEFDRITYRHSGFILPRSIHDCQAMNLIFLQKGHKPFHFILPIRQ